MKVCGLLKQDIEVNISEGEVFKALSEIFEIEKCFDAYAEGYWKVEKTEQGTDVLNHYRDTSYHGSACYEVNNTIENPYSIQAYKYIKALKELYVSKYEKERK